MELSVKSLIAQHLRNPYSSFSIGSFGAIAEFQRDSSERANITTTEILSVKTELGAIKIDLHESTKAIAYESLSKSTMHWRNGIVFFLPTDLAKSKRRKVLTELGPDWSAIRDEDREVTLFDLGLGTSNIDFCIRTHNEQLLKSLRLAEGRSVFENGNSIMSDIVAASPHRVAISKLGRIEVYQRIPTVQTPDGPHTHVLPKLLRTGRTHSANVPVPDDYLPCLSCYPPSPLYDSLGNETPFDLEKFQDFMAILEVWGLPNYLKAKKNVLEAIQQSVDPADFKPPNSRLGRTALRVTLRQLTCQTNNSSLLKEWQRTFDPVVSNSVD